MKKTKIALALLMSATILLAGCGGKEKGTVANSDMDLSSYPVKTDVALTYWSSLPVNISTSVDNFGATEIAKEFEKRTGIKIKYIHPAAGQEREALSLMVSANELPDIIESNWGIYPGGPTKALNEEILIPIDDYKEYAPGYFGFLEKHPEYAKGAKTDEGDHYAFVSIQDGPKLLMAAGPAVRMDWLEELGLEEPKTYDDWTNMLRAFKEKKGAEAPLSFNYANIYYFFNMFGASFDPYIDGNEVKYGPVEPEFKEALEIIHGWFEEGLLDKNIVSVDAKLIDSQVLSGKTGAVVTTGGGGIGQYMKLASKDNPKFNLAAVRYPTKDGSPNKTLPVSNNVSSTGAGITSQCAYPALAAKALDYYYTDEGYMLANFGIEGLSYNMVDGYPTYTDLILNNPDGLTVSQALGLYMKAGNGGAFVLDERYIEQYYGLPQQQKALKDWNVGVEESLSRRVPALTATTEEASEYAKLMNEIDKYRGQMIVKFITGIEPIENFDKYVETMKKLGVEKAMDIKTKALVRYNNR